MTSRSFDFEKWAPRTNEFVPLIRRFAEHEALRSATVDELVLGDEFHRRPLRPEDLSFIDFSRPVTEGNAHQLGFLAAQRLLLSIHELGVAGFPRDSAPETFSRIAAFYDDEQRVLGARVLPFLEAFSFDFVEPAPLATDIRRGALVDQLRQVLSVEAAFWRRALENFGRASYLEQGLRFSLIQTWSLIDSKRAALGRAAGARFFEPLGAENLPRVIGAMPIDGLVRDVALRAGVERQAHGYWQFYLSTSLASCNWLHALARRPDRALQLYGAAFVAEAEWLAVGCLAGMAAARFGLEETRTPNWGQAVFNDVLDRFERTLSIVEQKWGARGLVEVASGLSAATALGAVSRRNLGEQLGWLCSMDAYRDMAERIDQRIRAERPDIDRETFVEPREMCSTTHVHNDHRLVLIESGNMVFWANLGMTLRLAPGEMVLVPEGRLHGSSIESPVCTYHQPIIPEEWVRPLMDELTQGAARERVVDRSALDSAPHV